MNKNTNKKFKYKHSLGQNFIIDEFLLEDIADASKISKNDYVLEIGPGNGALTRCLCDRAKYVVTVEIDKSLLPLLKSNLKEYQNLSIINADFMNYEFDNILNEFKINGFDKDSNYIKVVANLPYYITSPIINSLLLNPYINEMTLMVQKEVAERIIAKPNTKDFGILTLSCNYFSDTELLMIVSKDCFYPKPKVDSAVVHFTKLHINKKALDENYKDLFALIHASFSQRRKKLINSLSNVLKIDKETLKSALLKLNFDENVRAENLSLDDYKNLLSLLF